MGKNGERLDNLERLLRVFETPTEATMKKDRVDRRKSNVRCRDL